MLSTVGIGFLNFLLVLVENSCIYARKKKPKILIFIKIKLGLVVTCNSKYKPDDEKAENREVSSLRSRFLGCYALRDIPKNGCGGDYEVSRISWFFLILWYLKYL